MAFVHVKENFVMILANNVDGGITHTQKLVVVKEISAERRKKTVALKRRAIVNRKPSDKLYFTCIVL